MSRNIARLIEALADKREFDHENASVRHEFFPHLKQKIERINARILDFAQLCGLDADDLSDLDARVKRELQRRRDIGRRRREHIYADAFDGMLELAGLKPIR